MALEIGSGIFIGGSITVTNEIALNPNQLLLLDAGNSQSYSGSGVLNSFNYLNGVHNLATANVAGNLTGFTANVSWVNQGGASYFSFNAVDNTYINTEAMANVLPGGSGYTYAAWVRPQDYATGAIVGGDQSIFTFGPTGGPNDGPSLVAANSYGNPSFVPAVVDDTTVFEIDTWYFVAVTYDSSSQLIKLWVNGINTATGTSLPFLAPEPLYWGTLEGQLYYTGEMGLVTVYDKPLSDALMLGLYNEYAGRYVDPVTTSSALYTLPGSYSFTVPEGVTSISTVVVGGGGGGTADSYSPPGGDTFLYIQNTTVSAQTLYTTTPGNTTANIYVNSITTPTITNVTADGTWLVSGSDIVGPAIAVDLVTAVDSTNPSNVIITINKQISTTAGDSFVFLQSIAAAEGAYEIVDSAYNQNGGFLNNPGGPGPRAQALVTDGPYGQGGVVDWTDSWPIGGGGGGGYGIAGLAWSVNQAGVWYTPHNGPDTGNVYHTMSFTNNNLTVNGLVGIGDSGQETTVIGTELIPANAKIMYSVTINQLSGVLGDCGVGLANYNTDLWNYVGATGTQVSYTSVGYYDDGNVYTNSGVVATYAPFNQGSIIDIAVDMTAGMIWFRADGGNWNGGGSADPATNTGGLDINNTLSQPYPVSLAASTWYNTNTSQGDIVSIATSEYFAVPSGFTFIPGVPGAGGTGGGGTSSFVYTAISGVGGSSGGGGGRFEDSGAGGGGTGLYGRGANGVVGTWVDTNIDPTGIALGGGGGSVGGISGGPATPWNGGRGGFPGGGGGSATGYWDGGNGGALAYCNNYTVTPGQGIGVYVGIGGQGQSGGSGSDSGGGSGGPGAVRIVWPGDTRQFPTTNVGPDTVAVPTLAITDYNLPAYNPNGTVDWTIASDGGSTVLETGIIWGLPGQDFYANSTDICDGTSSTAERKAIRAADSCSNPYTTGLTGAQTLNFQPSYQFYDDLINVRVYARNEAGVAYSPTTLTWTPHICLAEGTLITLADGNTKLIEDITMLDLIQVWDFDTATATSARPLWIKRQESTIQYNLIRFSDGSELKTIGQHRIFNKEAGAFTYPMTADTPVGTTTVKADGTEVTVVDKRIVYAAVNYYNVVTDGGYMNLYANNILTSLRYNNIYPIANMQYTKDTRVIRDRAEFAGIADRWIDGLRLPEQTTDIKDIRKYVARLEANEARESLSAHPSWHK